MAKLEEEGYIAKLRGLPWSATVEDIQKFFRDCKILCGKMGIHMTTSREGRPSGEAFVEFEDADDLEIAVQKDREHIGNRYIEVFKVNKAEMDWVIKRSGPNATSNEDGCVRLRGLPFGCSKEEIAQFFTGLEIVPNGITLLTDYSGRSSGEAYVQFVNREVAEKALLKHREKIGHRWGNSAGGNEKYNGYIEIFRSSLSEIHNVLGYQGTRRSGVNGGSYSSRPGPYDRDTSSSRYGSNRFQARASRSFKGANFSNNDYGEYDRSNWSNNARNGEITNNRNSFPNNSWGNNNRAASGLHCVHMRGLPFKATEADVADFFKPVVPINIHLLLDLTGRASGEADVEFASHDDAVRAMTKDKGHMEHRYIELFLNSSGGTSNGTTGRRRM